MKCRKHRFRDEIAAKLALASMSGRRHERRNKDERRVYRCPTCQGWHLTSKAREPKG